MLSSQQIKSSFPASVIDNISARHSCDGKHVQSHDIKFCVLGVISFILIRFLIVSLFVNYGDEKKSMIINLTP